MFSVQQLDRYARHIVLDGVGAEGQLRLGRARVVVIGAGGLGAPILLYLAGAGVGELEVLDDDEVALSNLQRQVLFVTRDVGRPKADVAAAHLAELNPDIRVRGTRTRVTAATIEAAIEGATVVVDGSDNFPTRYVVNDACVAAGIPLVYGAVSQFDGQVSVLNGRHADVRGPCYRCMFPQPPVEGTVPSCAEAGVFGALPGAIGSMMAGEAIKLIVGVGTPLVGVLLHLDLADGTVHRFELRRDAACPACGDPAPAPR